MDPQGALNEINALIHESLPTGYMFRLGNLGGMIWKHCLPTNLFDALCEGQDFKLPQISEKRRHEINKLYDKSEL